MHLVLAQDEEELRATGGFLGAIWTLTTENGRLVDRQFLPYIALGLLSVNIAFAYYSVAVGTGRVVDLVMALTLLVGGAVLHTFWQSWD